MDRRLSYDGDSGRDTWGRSIGGALRRLHTVFLYSSTLVVVICFLSDIPPSSKRITGAALWTVQSTIKRGRATGAGVQRRWHAHVSPVIELWRNRAGGTD